jgi:DNA-binding NarL/FixJ family response regulator
VIKSVLPSRNRRERPLSWASVLLADDQEEFLAIERRLLEPEFQVVETVRDGQAAVAAAVRLAPDLLVLDVSMPVLDGIAAARSLRAAGSQAKIVFLTVHGDPDYVRAALAVGAVGYVVKCRLASDLVPALRDALAGRSFVSPSMPQAPTRTREL